MKKQLLAGTAFVAAAMLVAGGAMAQDKMKKKMMKPSISVNGSYEGIVGGILDEDLGAGAQDTPALDTRTDAEIHFNGRATLDSGMKIHARVELEGMDEHAGARPDKGFAQDPIDEYFIAVSGSFGQIVLGGTGGAPVRMLTGTQRVLGNRRRRDPQLRQCLGPTRPSWPAALLSAALAAGHGRLGEGHLHLPEIRRLPGRRDLHAGRSRLRGRQQRPDRRQRGCPRRSRGGGQL